MNKKTCVITGATAGIGFGIAKGLAVKGHNLVLIGRNEKKGNDAIIALKKIAENLSVRYYNVDLSSQRQIRAVGGQLAKEHPVIDVLINNAGIWTSKYELTEDNIEKQFAVNHLAYFMLTHVLYPAIARAADGRIINIGSDSHFFGKMHFDNPGLKNSYHGLKAYAQSKLANVLFTYELHRLKKDQHVSVNCVQPGLVKTDIGIKHTSAFHSLMWKLRRLTGQSPEKAAETAIYLATAEAARNSSGMYWDKSMPKPSSKPSYNKDDAKALWKLSEELCDINSFF